MHYLQLKAGNHYAIVDWNPDTAPHQVCRKGKKGNRKTLYRLGVKRALKGFRLLFPLPDQAEPPLTPLPLLLSAPCRPVVVGSTQPAAQPTPLLNPPRCWPRNYPSIDICHTEIGRDQTIMLMPAMSGLLWHMSSCCTHQLLLKHKFVALPRHTFFWSDSCCHIIIV